MAKYFTMAELTASDSAKALGIDNTPPSIYGAALSTLANKLLDPVREMWGAPITVNSGYRCPQLNKAVGGVASSRHTKGEAADITAGSPEKNRRLFDMTVAAQSRGELSFDQLIDESDYKWIHISYKSAGNRNQILHLK
jgi:hypothetical protein